MFNLNDAFQRRAYHKAFVEWLSNCTTEEAECFDHLQRHKPTDQVIPMMNFMEQCLSDPEQRGRLPKGLVERLQAANWPPAQSVGANA